MADSKIGTRRHGCCVIQYCYSNAPPLYHARLVQKIMTSALTLIQDPFGNYVIQYVMEHGSQEESNIIARSTFGNIPALMCQKFSSNVIEKLFAYADEAICSKMVDEVIRASVFSTLLHNSVRGVLGH